MGLVPGRITSQNTENSPAHRFLLRQEETKAWEKWKPVVAMLDQKVKLSYRFFTLCGSQAPAGPSPTLKRNDICNQEDNAGIMELDFQG